MLHPALVACYPTACGMTPNGTLQLEGRIHEQIDCTSLRYRDDGRLRIGQRASTVHNDLYADYPTGGRRPVRSMERFARDARCRQSYGELRSRCRAAGDGL